MFCGNPDKDFNAFSQVEKSIINKKSRKFETLRKGRKFSTLILNFQPHYPSGNPIMEAEHS